MTDAHFTRRGRPPKDRSEISYPPATPPMAVQDAEPFEPDAPSQSDLPEGWEDIETAPRDGTFIRLSKTGEGYATGRWKRTRHFVGNRWIPTGLWVDELNTKISFDPKLWQPRKGA